MSIAVPGSGCGHVRFLENFIPAQVNNRGYRVLGFVSLCRQDIYLTTRMLCSCLYDLYALYAEPRHTLHTFHTQIPVEKRTYDEHRSCKSNACKPINASSIIFNLLATIYGQTIENNKSVFCSFTTDKWAPLGWPNPKSGLRQDLVFSSFGER